MRRVGRAVLFGFVWFLILWIGSMAVAGMIVGAIAGSKCKDAQEAVRAGREAGRALGKTYGPLFLLGAAGIAAIGSIAGFLPWTRPKRRATMPYYQPSPYQYGGYVYPGIQPQQPVYWQQAPPWPQPPQGPVQQAPPPQTHGQPQNAPCPPQDPRLGPPAQR